MLLLAQRIGLGAFLTNLFLGWTRPRSTGTGEWFNVKAYDSSGFAANHCDPSRTLRAVGFDHFLADYLPKKQKGVLTSRDHAFPEGIPNTLY